MTRQRQQDWWWSEKLERSVEKKGLMLLGWRSPIDWISDPKLYLSFIGTKMPLDCLYFKMSLTLSNIVSHLFDAACRSYLWMNLASRIWWACNPPFLWLWHQAQAMATLLITLLNFTPQWGIHYNNYWPLSKYWLLWFHIPWTNLQGCFGQSNLARTLPLSSCFIQQF